VRNEGRKHDGKKHAGRRPRRLRVRVVATRRPTPPAAHALLALCARPHLPSELQPELARRAALVERWDETLTAAEHHGVGPLLYRHLRAGGIRVPPGELMALQALYVRHRRENAIRLGALREILDAFDASGITARILKGPALMALVYVDPALRPIADLDLLIRTEEVFQAQHVLRRLGFRAPGTESRATLRHHHHLPVATRPTDGIVVQVELHHDGLSGDDRVSIRLNDLREPAMTFDVCGRQASTLGMHEMLWHICQHLVGPLPHALRMIWVADVVGYAEGFCERLDWERIGRQYDVVLNVLGLAHALTPLPPPVLRHVPPLALEGLSAAREDEEAWSAPMSPIAGAAARLRQLGRVLNPPAWWLQVKYGARGGTAGRLARHLWHLAIVERAVRRRAWTALEGGREV
jgi:Uncharacterised nucleotidyltransferase